MTFFASHWIVSFVCNLCPHQYLITHCFTLYTCDHDLLFEDKDKETLEIKKKHKTYLKFEITTYYSKHYFK